MAAVQAPPATATARRRRRCGGPRRPRRRRGDPRRRRRRRRRAPHRRRRPRPAPPRACAQGRRHAPAVDPRRPGRVQDAVHRAEGREQRPGLFRRDLGDLARRPPQRHVRERGEPGVLVGPQAEERMPQAPVARRLTSRRRRPAAPAPPGSAGRPGAGTATVAGRCRRWWRARGSRRRRRWPAPDATASTTVTLAPRQASS